MTTEDGMVKVSGQEMYLADLRGWHTKTGALAATDEIDSHLDETIKSTKLTAEFGLSSRTLTRRFVAATGHGPQAYLQLVRVRHAQRLLETTGESVDEIRRAAGYHDPAAFRRVFKQTTGLSPNAYRNRYGPKSH